MNLETLKVTYLSAFSSRNERVLMAVALKQTMYTYDVSMFNLEHGYIFLWL